MIRLHLIKGFIFIWQRGQGLTNEELQLANTHIEIPANPEYPVLNLAMSAQIVCYEIFKSHFNKELEIGMIIQKSTREFTNVNRSFIETAVNIDVIHPDNPKKIISRIKRMFSRLHPDEMEIVS